MAMLHTAIRRRAGLLRSNAGRRWASTVSTAAAAAASDGVRFAGTVWPIVATPFHRDDPNESIDLARFRESIAFFARAGCGGATIVGVLGEANRLTDTERGVLVAAAVDAAGGRMPICVGVSHAGTTATRDLAVMAGELGARAVMVTPSREPSPLPPARVVDYFARACDGLGDLSIVVQDHPASTQVFMSVDTVADVVNAIGAERVGCIKLESTPTAPRIGQLKALLPDGSCPPILCGLGALYAQPDLEGGADGFMTGFAFPEALQAFVDHKDDADTLFKLYKQWLPLMVYEQQPGLGVRKEAYCLRGIASSNAARHPAAAGPAPGQADALARLVERTVPAAHFDVTQPLDVAALVAHATTGRTD